ncbi:MAG: 3-isopropylmalate dehydratase [Pseudomonadota bacterium]
MTAAGIIEGRAWVFGDNIDTDVLAPGYLMKLPPEELAKHCLEAVNPDFAANVKPGDVLVAGDNLGLGSSREQAAQSLKILGVGALVAKSFARIFYRNAINFGVPAFFLGEAGDIRQGDKLRIDLAAGRIENLDQDRVYAAPGLPDHLMEVIAAGGLMAHLERRLDSAGGARP